MTTILVIDDSPTILRVAELVLVKAGFRVVTANDGDEGLKQARNEKPHLILLDFVMPRMNGYQVCRELAADAELSAVPVLLMSAKGEHVGERFVKTVAVRDYITKPFSPEALLAIVQNTLAQSGVAIPSEVARAISEPTGLGGVLPERELAEDLARFVAVSARTADQIGEVDLTMWVKQNATQLLTIANTSAWFAGDLRIAPLVELLRFLGRGDFSGQLSLTGDTATADIFVRNGRIDLASLVGTQNNYLLGRFLVMTSAISEEQLEKSLKDFGEKSVGALLGQYLCESGVLRPADLHRALTMQTKEIIFELLKWRRGRFYFSPKSLLPRSATMAGLQLGIDTILLEGLRRVEEWHLIEPQLGDFDVVFVRNDDNVAALGESRLTKPEIVILELANGRNSVKEIARQSHLGAFETSRILYRLLALHLIRKAVAPVCAS